MITAHRPTLSAVMGKASTPAPSSRKSSKRANGCEQLNVLIPGELRRSAKASAMRQGRDISDVVTELLTGWLANQSAS